MKVYLESFGCSASQASAEIMKASVERLGHELVGFNTVDQADVYICNSCTVKYTTEQKILYKIRRMGERGIQVIVSGCMPEVQLEDILHANPEAHILGVNDVSCLGDVLSSIEQRKKKDDYKEKNVLNSGLPNPLASSMFHESVPTPIFTSARSLRAAISPVRTAL